MATHYSLPGTGTQHEVDPISRIEGHLGVKVEVDGSGNIIDANAHGNLWRGFENFLLGRDVNDAITFTQRICGVCPVPHGMTSTYAADTVLGYSAGHITFLDDGTYGVPEKALLIRNLVLSAEFLMSSITHFYHLVAPSYVQGPAIPPWTPYFADGVYNALLRGTATGANAAVPGVIPDYDAGTMQLWDAVIISYVRALKIRRLTFEAGALFAGRMPMTSCYTAGGVTNDYTMDLSDRCDSFRTLIQEVGLFIINEYVPIALALGYLYQDYDNVANGGANAGIGAGCGRFLAWGAFPNTDNSLTLPGGVLDTTAQTASFQVLNKAQVASTFLAGGTHAVADNLTEDITWSRYSVADADTDVYTNGAAYPGDVTRTKPNRDNGYTYMKAPRWDGLPCEVGPLARLLVAGIIVPGNPYADVPGYKEIYTIDGSGNALDPGVLAPTIVAGLSNTAGGLVGTIEGWILNLEVGLSNMDRIRARALESLVLVQAMVGSVTKDASGNLHFGSDGWIDELQSATGATCNQVDTPTGETQGWGATEAPRGALMHQCTAVNGRITAYQCIVPTTWNGSPKDASGNNGPIEAAVIGAPFDATAHVTVGGGGGTISTTGGVEVVRIAQTFDPCIACAVH